MSSDPVPITSVRGGSGGTDAELRDLDTLAEQFDRAGDQFREHGIEVGKAMGDGDLLASAILSPGSFSQAEAKILAVAGELEIRGAAAEVDAFLVHACVDAYRLADDMVAGLYADLQYLGGFALGFGGLGALATAPLLLPAGGLVALGAVGSNPALLAALANPDNRAALADLTSTEGQAFLEDHPELVEFLAGGGGGLVDGLTAPVRMLPGGTTLLDKLGIDPVHPTLADGAGELSGLFTDGEAEPPTVSERLSGPSQTSVEGLLTELKETNDAPVAGTVDVREVTTTGPDGPVTRYIVDIPGTKDWSLPGSQGSVAADLGSNVRLTAGQDTVYSRGIAVAMEEAGVPPGANVMLVGHSQGGMTAAALAADPGFGYDVDYLVTAGSPIGSTEIPESTQILSLENDGDLVPRLDGAPNRDEVNRTTVGFDGRTGSVGGNHSMGQYVAGGAAVDASGDPSLRSLIDGMREDGYLGEGRSETSRLVVSRQQ